MKMYFAILLALIQMFSFSAPNNGKLPASETINVNRIPAVTHKTELTSISVKAKAAIVYDCKENKILYTKNPKEKIAPASLAKLLTAVTALEYVSADKEFILGNELRMIDASSSSCFLKIGQKISLRNLIYGMLVPSGCDAAYAIAVNVAKEVNTINEMSDQKAFDFFVYLMNKQAKKIGMKNSNFKSPDGFDEENQYITAEDMLKLTATALNSPVIKEVVGTFTKTIKYNSGDPVTWENTNKFLDPASRYYNPNVHGVKTGSSDMAGMSVSCEYRDSEDRIITIVLGCDSFWDRYKEAEKLINWAKKQY